MAEVVSGEVRVLLLLLLGVAPGLLRAAPSPAPTPQIPQQDSTEIASQIVQQLQTLGHHKFPGHAARSVHPGNLQALPGALQYEAAAAPYYDPYAEYYKLEPPEPTMDPSLTPSGINISGALGFISYLVLLVLLQSAVEGVAARSSTRRRRSSATLAPEDLTGRALHALSHPQDILNHLQNTLSNPEDFKNPGNPPLTLWNLAGRVMQAISHPDSLLKDFTLTSPENSNTLTTLWGLAGRAVQALSHPGGVLSDLQRSLNPERLLRLLPSPLLGALQRGALPALDMLQTMLTPPHEQSRNHRATY